MIPARASVKIDFRLVPNMTPDDVEFKLRDHLNRNGFKDITVTRMGAMYPYKAAGDDPLFHLASKMAEQVYGQPLRIDTLGGGSSPIYSFAGPLGNIPVIWAGVGGPNGNAHSPDENISIKNFINGTRYISRILDGFSTLP
jgi:acetylornithine deacetylase/succinyl-diaminopimelate desuccinylase-like protein